jgi:hypothetical protein
MEHKKIAAALIILALIIAGMFAYAFLKKSELQNDTADGSATTTDSEDSPYAGITRIDGKRFFENGTHTIVGEIPMPTPCDLLNWTTRIQESMPETVIIDFDVINNSEVCAQVVTPQRFKVTFSASEQANVRATLEGREVELNLVPASPGESPDDFELFIKG